MGKSNVIANSNVLLFKTNYPWRDSEFMTEIEDYSLLKYYEEKQKNGDNQAIAFSDKQKEILKTELRCIHAKNDPCWGYIDSLKKVVSKCINGKCPLIHRCNPLFTVDYAALWQPSYEDCVLYKEPHKIRKYYFVDMISDDEMLTYKSLPEFEGYSFNVQKEPWEEVPKYNRRKIKIDPKTGKKMVIVGYDWKITDNANYESEEMFPIWDYENEEIIEDKEFIRPKAKKIEKKPIVDKEYRFDLDENKKNIERNIVEKVKLTKFSKNITNDKEVVVLFSNPAELAFASNILLINNVEHGYRNNIKLVLFEDYGECADEELLIISNSILMRVYSEEEKAIWEKLSSKKDIRVLNIMKRDYQEFVYGGGSFWTCANMYGITHICIKKEDLQLLDENDCKLTSIVLNNESDKYIMYDAEGVQIGALNSVAQNKLQFLEERGEIPGQPNKIEGVSIRIEDGIKEVLGIGHLKFSEY